MIIKGDQVEVLSIPMVSGDAIPIKKIFGIVESSPDKVFSYFLVRVDKQVEAILKNETIRWGSGYVFGLGHKDIRPSKIKLT